MYESVNQPEVLLQFHTAGVLVQFEALLSTYGTPPPQKHTHTRTYIYIHMQVCVCLLCVCVCVGDEVGMLEDMEVGVSDLSRVAFCVTAATSDHPDHLLPTLRGTR